MVKGSSDSRSRWTFEVRSRTGVVKDFWTEDRLFESSTRRISDCRCDIISYTHNTYQPRPGGSVVSESDS